MKNKRLKVTVGIPILVYGAHLLAGWTSTPIGNDVHLWVLALAMAYIGGQSATDGVVGYISQKKD